MNKSIAISSKSTTRRDFDWNVLRATLTRSLIIILLAITSLMALFPLYFLIVTAFKGQSEFVVNQLGLPMHPVLTSIEQAFQGREIPLWFINSVFVTGTSVAGVTFVGSLAAFAFARMQFWGKNTIFNIIISLMVVPPVVMIIPIFVLMVNIHLINSLFSAIIVYIGLMLPFSIYLLTSFFQTIPQEIVDAAVVDGCSDFAVYRMIMLPLALPAISTLVIVNSLFVWNELLVALILLQKNELKTLMVGLTAFKSRYNMNVPVTMAGLLFATLPLIIIYLIGQRGFIRGLVAGSLKG